MDRESVAYDLVKYKNVYHHDQFLTKIRSRINEEKRELERLYSVYENTFDAKHILSQYVSYYELVLMKEPIKIHLITLEKETKEIEDLAGPLGILKKLSLEDCTGKTLLLKDKIKRLEEVFNFVRGDATICLPLE